MSVDTGACAGGDEYPAPDRGDDVVARSPVTERARPYRETPTPVRFDKPSIRERFALTWIDGVFAMAVVATAATYFHLMRDSFFWADDWRLALRGRSLGDFVQPYNGHLSIVVIAVYRVLYKVFGFDTYLPWRIVAIGSLLAIPVSLYLVLRAKVGPLLAGAVGVYFLWFPDTILNAAAMNHWLAATAGVACAYALGRRDRGGDLFLAIALSIALASAGGGLTVAAACGVYALCTRAGPRRWFAVLGPTILWFVWWVRYGRDTAQVPEPLRLDASAIVDTTIDGIRASFDALVFGNRVAGIVLLVAFIVHLGWRLRAGITAAANTIAWTAALIFWWVGLCYSRGVLLELSSFRYALVGGVFIVLALVPAAPVKLPRRLRPSDPIGALALVVLAAVIVVANQGAIRDGGERVRAAGAATKLELLATNLSPRALPESQRLRFGVGNLTVGQYRELVDEYGVPVGTSRAEADRTLVAVSDFQLEPSDQKRTCFQPNNQMIVLADDLARIVTTDEATDVSLSRFGDVPIPIGTVAANKTVDLQLAGPTQEPWTVRAPGACVAFVSAPPE